jgi:hypothetical protein
MPLALTTRAATKRKKKAGQSWQGFGQIASKFFFKML